MVASKRCLWLRGVMPKPNSTLRSPRVSERCLWLRREMHMLDSANLKPAFQSAAFGGAG